MLIHTRSASTPPASRSESCRIARPQPEVLFVATLRPDQRARYEAACDRAASGARFVDTVQAARALLESRVVLPRCLFLQPEVEGAEELVSWLRGDPLWIGIPIIALGNHPSEGAFLSAHAIGADDVALEGDPGALTRRVAALGDEDWTAPRAAWRGHAWIAHPNEHRRRVVGRTLRRAGYDVSFAASREELLARTQVDDRTELVVIAQELVGGGASTIDVLREQKARRDLPVVVLRPADSTDHLGEAIGRTGVLSDDASPDSLLFVVNELGAQGAADARSSQRLLFSTLCAFRREHELQPDYGLSYNVSREGIYVRTLDPPARGTVVWLEVRPPGTTRIVHLRVRVMWTCEASASGRTTPPGFGAQILEDQCPAPDLQRYRDAYAAFVSEPRPYRIGDLCKVSMAPEAPAETAEAGRLLVIDDDPRMQKVYRRMLGRAGYDVVTAEDGARGVEKFRSGRFDAVVTDLDMPRMDGVQVLHAIRQRDQSIPVIIATGAPSTQSAIAAVEHGAFHYFTKPLDPPEVISTVGRAVSMARLSQLQREALALHAEALGAQGPDETHSSFERALDKLFLHYQPIVSWRSKKVFGYEALVRSAEPALPHPGALFGAAEKLGRLDELGRAIRAIATAPFGPEHGQLFVNLHPRDLMDDTLFRADSSLAQMAPRVTLEITERASLSGIPDFAQRIADLRALGFSIAVDDIGAGYAGLTSFAQLEPDVAKLDMSLIRDVHRIPTKQRLVRSFCELCGDLGIKLVAEGVETVEERDTLVDLGCDLLQGYLLAKPGPAFPDVDF